jgi:hypothetical protein
LYSGVVVLEHLLFAKADAGFAKRTCSTKQLERGDDLKKSRPDRDGNGVAADRPSENITIGKARTPLSSFSCLK